MHEASGIDGKGVRLLLNMCYTAISDRDDVQESYMKCWSNRARLGDRPATG